VGKRQQKEAAALELAALLLLGRCSAPKWQLALQHQCSPAR
jgi:hypothetical protein